MPVTVKHDHEPFPCVLYTDDVYPKLEPTPVSEAAWRSLLMEIEYIPRAVPGLSVTSFGCLAFHVRKSRNAWLNMTSA